MRSARDLQRVGVYPYDRYGGAKTIGARVWCRMVDGGMGYAQIHRRRMRDGHGGVGATLLSLLLIKFPEVKQRIAL